jgi:hypothetical protein
MWGATPHERNMPMDSMSQCLSEATRVLNQAANCPSLRPCCRATSPSMNCTVSGRGGRRTLAARDACRLLTVVAFMMAPRESLAFVSVTVKRKFYFPKERRRFHTTKTLSGLCELAEVDLIFGRGLPMLRPVAHGARRNKTPSSLAAFECTALGVAEVVGRSPFYV